MNLVIKLVVFSIMLNLATGIIMEALPDLSPTATTSGVFYFENKSKSIIEDTNFTTTASGVAGDSVDSEFRIIDLIGIMIK